MPSLAQRVFSTDLLPASGFATPPSTSTATTRRPFTTTVPPTNTTSGNVNPSITQTSDGEPQASTRTLSASTGLSETASRLSSFSDFTPVSSTGLVQAPSAGSGMKSFRSLSLVCVSTVADRSRRSTYESGKQHWPSEPRRFDCIQPSLLARQVKNCDLLTTRARVRLLAACPVAGKFPPKAYLRPARYQPVHLSLAISTWRPQRDGLTDSVGGLIGGIAFVLAVLAFLRLWQKLDMRRRKTRDLMS